MNWHVQFIRESKSLVVWCLIPFIGLMSIFKGAWDWYLNGVLDTGSALQLLVSMIAVVACGYLSHKDYRRWQADVLAETTDIGQVVRVASTNDSNGAVLRLMVVVTMILILAIFRPIAFASILILWCVGTVWWSFISTFMATSKCIIGTQGLWIAFMGWKVSVPYSSIDRIGSRTGADHTEVWVTLFAKEALTGRLGILMPLDQEVVNILEDHIRVVSPTSLKVQ